MKRFALLILTLLMIFCVIFGLIACDSIDKSAYEIWLDAGNEGTEDDFLEWLKDEKNYENLQYEKIFGKEEYCVVGRGNVSDPYIVIPTTYKGLPVTEIGGFGQGYSSWDGTKLIVLQSGIKSIKDRAFAYCHELTNIIIPDSVKSIGEDAFYDCSKLRYNEKDGLKYLGSENNKYLYLAGVVSTDIVTVTIDSNCKHIGSKAFYECDSLTSVVIPNSVKNIGSSAFRSCDALTSVTIGDSVKNIGNSAFRECYALTSVTIGNGVEIIENYAFYFCDALRSIVIPDNVQRIGYNAFGNCYLLASVTIGNSVKYIGSYAFRECSMLTSIIIPNSVTTISMNAFEYCFNLETIYCEAESKPSGWESAWMGWYCSARILWGNAWEYVDGVPTKTQK